MNAPRVFRGVAEARKWWQSEVDEAWDTQKSYDEIEEIFDLGDLIVAVVRAVDVGATSGIMVDSRTGIVWELEAGKIERLRVFLDPEEALRLRDLRHRPSRFGRKASVMQYVSVRFDARAAQIAWLHSASADTPPDIPSAY